MKRSLKLLTQAALVLTFLLGSTQGSWALELVRAPYLQIGTPSSMTIAWRTDFAASGFVRYGTNINNLNMKSSVNDPAKDQVVVLLGLAPNTRYYYTVHTDSGALTTPDELIYFETSPETGSKTPVRMWVVGDSGTGGTAQKNVRNAMVSFVNEKRPNLFLHMGDMAYGDGEDLEFTNNFFGIYSDILSNTVCWPTMGNHEGYSSNANDETGPYYEGYVLPTKGEAGGLASGTEAYYSFDYANIHFIVLESHQSSRDVGSPMLTWLEADIASTDQDWIIAYWHHGPYTKGSHDSDTESRHIDMRQNALPILEAGGVDLVLAGHSHIYERTFLVDGAYDTPTTAEGHIVDGGDGRPGGDGPYVKSPGLNAHEGAVYVTAGHGGAGVSQDGPHPLMYFAEVKNGSCIIDVEGAKLSLMNVRYDGAKTDYFTIMKGDGLVLGHPTGGEIIEAGKATSITWTTIGSVAAVDIDYSLNGGNLWIPLGKGLPNTGIYNWTIPQVDTSSGRVRIRASDVPDLSDESSANFKITTVESTVYFPFGDSWSYHDQNQDPGTAWNTATYDDSDWASGPAQLGYGDGDEATVLEDQNPNVPTVYFRKKIVLNELPGFVDLSVVYDDGYAAFINGTEVARDNVDSLSFIEWSVSTGAENGVADTSINIDETGPLKLGENVIAVLVKQRSETSSDVSFDAQMIGQTSQALPNTPPNLSAPSDQNLTVGQTHTMALNASDADGDGLVYLSSTLPEGANLDYQSGIFTWTASESQIGSRVIEFTVVDLRGLSDASNVKFTISKSTISPDTTNTSKDSSAQTEDSSTKKDLNVSVDTQTSDNVTNSTQKSSGCVAHYFPMKHTGFFMLLVLMGLLMYRRRAVTEKNS